MVVSQANRLYLRRIFRLRITKLLLLLFFLFNFLDVLRIHHNLSHGDRRLKKKKGAPTVPSRPHERVYIASMHFTDADLLKNYWSPALLDLTEVFGAKNVFVSIFESASFDNTKQMLGELDNELERRGVPHRIQMSNQMHQDELNDPVKGEGWIDTPRNQRELRRIPYLSRLRNKTLKDLVDLHEKGITFDKVLFLNDVVFTTDDVLTLMDTNGGEYAAACSLDFSKPPLYYDTFALRDIEGYPHVMQTWPYFRSKTSRNAIVNNLDAVPVTSCWNGIVVMPAEPFTASTRLKFRGVPDSLAKHHVEGSECCLIHADNPLSRTLGVYLNPRVRVGYNATAYFETHPEGSWVSAFDIFTGIWSNRFKRWTQVTFENLVIKQRVAKWEKERHGNHEPGVFCLINEMHVLIWNGWAHV